jgi:hypothetical protein
MAAAWHSSSSLGVVDLLVRGRHQLKDDEPGGVGGKSMAWRSIRRSTHELEVVGGGLSVVGAVVAGPFAPPPSPWPLLALCAIAAGSCLGFLGVQAAGHYSGGGAAQIRLGRRGSGRLGVPAGRRGTVAARGSAPAVRAEVGSRSYGAVRAAGSRSP